MFFVDTKDEFVGFKGCETDGTMADSSDGGRPCTNALILSQSYKTPALL